MQNLSKYLYVTNKNKYHIGTEHKTIITDKDMAFFNPKLSLGIPDGEK